MSIFTGCVSTRKIARTSDKQAGVSNEEPEEKEKAQDCFIQARDFERRGIIDMAEHYYELAYSFDPKSETLKDELVRRYIESEKPARALLLVKGQKSDGELSVKEKKIVSTIYIKMGEFEKAAGVLEMIPDKSDEEIYSLGLIYESLGKQEKALSNYLDFFRKNPESIQMGYKIGKLLIASKRLNEAESLYTEMLKNLGEKPDIFVMLGSLRVVQGDTASGLRNFSRALELDSVNEDALRNGAQVYLSRNDFASAIVNYEKLYKYNPLGEIFGRTLAILYYYNREYLKSENLLSELLKDAMDDYELHFYMGLVYEAEKKNELAVIEFEKTLTIRNTFDEAWKEMCFIALREKKYDDALKITERYLKVSPEKAGPWKLRGYVLSGSKDYKKAIDSFKKAVQIDSSDLNSWFELGSALERNREFNESVNVFRRILKVNPDDPSTLNYLGYMWAEKGEQLDSARVLIRKALDKDTGNGAFIDSYAWVLYKQNEIDSAYKYITAAARKIDDDPVVFEHLGDILNKKKEYSGALDAYMKCLDMNPENTDAIKEKICEIEELINDNRIKK